MRKIIILLSFRLIFSSHVLWVVYQDGCYHCDLFMKEVLSTYPDEKFLNSASAPQIKLVNILNDAQVFENLKPSVYSTPSFILFKDNSEIDRWAGFSKIDKFYLRLQKSLSMD